ncbi:hypothetical protein PMZ80_004888 [Knufia obscura]|uniref:Uncharacterized protein n=1 Tax=Knufia obscura TaxID=1635080 RepID=A0ABR0RP22_9EURO|nr:hypothetical protein PMZ80_004888 [Knufia obscura]
MPSGYNVTDIGGLPYVVYPDGTTYSTTGGKVDANCTLSVCPLDQSIYGYRPTLPGSAVLIALYGICAIIQLAMGIRYKTWGFMTVMFLGCLDEILGYVARIMYNQNPWNGSSFVMQIVTITIGPVFFCAAIYVMIYKIINYIDPSKARFNPRLIYWVFISCDIVSLALQSAGGGLSSDATGNSGMGVNIALAGLAFQVATLAAFMLVCADYAFRSRQSWRNTHLPTAFKSFVGFLTLAVLLIFIRCCYRVYELGNGYSRDSESLRDEGLFIGLESVMIVVAAFALVGAHPGLAFKKHGRDGSSSQKAMMAGEKIEDVDGSNAS